MDNNLLIITTKYYGPTNTRGSRIKCSAAACRAKFYPFNYVAPNPHLRAAERYLADLQLTGEYLGYDMAKDSGKLVVYRLK